MTDSHVHDNRCIAARLWFVTVVVSLIVAVSAAPAAHADTEACPTQAAALAGTLAKIRDHNARAAPGGVGPPEVAGPYNREADQLDAERGAEAAKLKKCIAITDQLRADGPPTKPLSAGALEGIRKAKAQVPSDWRAPSPLPTIGTRIFVPRSSPIKPLWDAINDQTNPLHPYPDVPLQGMPRPSSDDSHPSQPWKLIGTNARGGPAVSPDHIVPKVELVYLPRFMELTAENMWLVMNAPVNLQWLPSVVNSGIKNSRSAADMQGVDPVWHARQIDLQQEKRRQLTELIAQLVDTQTP